MYYVLLLFIAGVGKLLPAKSIYVAEIICRQFMWSQAFLKKDYLCVIINMDEITCLSIGL